MTTVRLDAYTQSMAVSSPNKVVSDSAASRNSVVEIPLSLAASTGTSAKDFWIVSNQVDMIIEMG